MPSDTNRPTPQDRRKPGKKGKKLQEKLQQEMNDPESPYFPTTWAGAASPSGFEDMIVPSGQKCLIRRPGLEGLMAAGVLHKIDSLTAMVGENHIKRVHGDKGDEQLSVDMESFLDDTEAVNNTLHTIDKLVCYVVIQPQIQMAPNDVTLRKPNVVYTDMIDIVDKMWIFTSIIGGVDDLATFRRTVLEPVGGMDAGEDVPASS